MAPLLILSNCSNLKEQFRKHTTDATKPASQGRKSGHSFVRWWFQWPTALGD